MRATRTENRNGIDPRGNRAAGTRTTSELVVELASGEPHCGLPANRPSELARDGLASGEPHGGSPANRASESPMVARPRTVYYLCIGVGVYFREELWGRVGAYYYASGLHTIMPRSISSCYSALTSS